MTGQVIKVDSCCIFLEEGHALDSDLKELFDLISSILLLLGRLGYTRAKVINTKLLIRLVCLRHYDLIEASLVIGINIVRLLSRLIFLKFERLESLYCQKISFIHIFIVAEVPLDQFLRVLVAEKNTLVSF